MAKYDVAIRGGRIVDGAGNPWYYSDIGVRDGKIVRIGSISGSEADRVIDASGLVVCPGFIDLHTHSDVTVLADGDAQSKVRQGVTWDVIGESNSVGPVVGPAAGEYREEQRLRYGVEVTWSDFTGYFQQLIRQGTSINIASSVAPQQIRRAVVGFDNRAAGSDELQMMKSLVTQAMEQGAVGLSATWGARVSTRTEPPIRSIAPHSLRCTMDRTTVVMTKRVAVATLFLFYFLSPGSYNSWYANHSYGFATENGWVVCLQSQSGIRLDERVLPSASRR